jgi:hypothetical protein
MRHFEAQPESRSQISSSFITDGLAAWNGTTGLLNSRFYPRAPAADSFIVP